MSKKILLTVGLLIAFIFTFAVTFSFATDNMAMNVVNDVSNGARDAVNGAENMVEGAVNGVTGASQNMTNSVEGSMNNMANTMTNGMTNNNQMSNYTTGRTATTRTATNNNAFMGMTSTAWTWLILGIAAVAIIAMVWYYSNQVSNSRRYDDND